jgi:predicted MFS family arabinose efflux permease
MVAGFVVLIGAAVVIRMKPITGHLAMQRDKTPLQHLWHTIQKKDYRIGFLATAMLSMGGFMIMPFTSAFLVNNVHILQEKLPIIFFCTGIASMVIMPLVGRLSDRIDKFKIFTAGSILASIMILIYTNLTPVTYLGCHHHQHHYVHGHHESMVPATTLNSAVPEPYDRGAYMSINSSLQQMAGGFAAMFAGFVVVQQTKTSPLEHFNWLGM